MTDIYTRLEVNDENDQAFELAPARKENRLIFSTKCKVCQMLYTRLEIDDANNQAFIVTPNRAENKGFT